MKDLCACLNLLRFAHSWHSIAFPTWEKALCEALNPSNRIEDVLRMQQETDEAHSLLAYFGGTPMIPFSDVHASLHLAQIGSSLSPRALLDIGVCLRASRAARDRL